MRIRNPGCGKILKKRLEKKNYNTVTGTLEAMYSCFEEELDALSGGLEASKERSLKKS
jgi:hypothetical protein